jgi:hypothetical protein
MTEPHSRLSDVIPTPSRLIPPPTGVIPAQAGIPRLARRKRGAGLRRQDGYGCAVIPAKAGTQLGISSGKGNP